MVFAGRQLRLDRPVAIKILRPEHATAVAAERFLAEGRLLARLAHPNIVPIYDAGESDGLLYYVMEFVDGETLADRLKRGPLPPAEAIRLARDLLAALSAAHAHDVVHRDVKPANIFLRGSQILLGDFGIARWRRDSDPGLTKSGQYIGTPSYMAPEQREGVAATPRSDVYSTGMVLYEACTGRRWPAYQPPDRADWSAVPSALVAPVRRALALDPAERWPDAREFAGAIRAGGRRVPRAALLAAAPFLGLVMVGYLVLRPHPLPARAGLTIEVESFTGVGPALGDSLAEALRGQLRGYSDWSVLPAGAVDPDSTVLRLGGIAALAGERLALTVQDRRDRRSPSAPLVVPRREVSRNEWHAAVDKIAADLIQAIWEQEDEFLPAGALPDSTEGRLLFFRAEQLWARAQWEEANAAYKNVYKADTTCALCSFRLLDIGRWLGESQDLLHLGRLQREQRRFSPVYQAMIHAMSTPLPGRLDTLKHAADTWDKFYLPAFHYGDELLHRGALYGRLRSEAGAPLLKTVQLAPHFDPGWEHLAFFDILQGDSLGSATALAALGKAPAGSQFSAAFRTLLRIGHLWRFMDPVTARQQTKDALGERSVRSNPDAAGGARLLMMLDAPKGAVELGGMLARMTSDPAAVNGGLLGQLTGYAALGQLDSLRATGERLRRQGDEKNAFLALELEVVLRCFDPEPALCADPSLSEALRLRQDSSALGRRAAWARGLLAALSHDSASLATARGALRMGASPGSFGRILDAAERGTALPSLPPLEAEKEYDDPLEDAVVRLLRSDSLLKRDQTPAARDLLRWQEHVQLSGHLIKEPQAGELAWALGTLVRWKRSQLLEKVGRGTNEHCSTYLGVARLWHDAPAPYGARADSAQRSLKLLRCAAP